MQERFEQAPIQVGHLTTTLQQQVGESVDGPSVWFVRGFAFATVVVLLDELGNLQNAFTSNSEVWFRIFCGLRTGM